MRATLTILGLYNYDTSIFENLVVPDDVDSATAINSICMDNAELELMYPEPDTMKFLIGLWSTRMLPVWERVLSAITEQYNPLENYNRTETWTDTEDEDTSVTSSGTESGSVSVTGSGSSTRTPNLTDTHKVVGFNDTNFTNASQDSQTGTEGVSTSNTDSTTTSGTNSGSGTGSKDKTTVHSGNVSGNIGVTTSQQMLNQELEISPKVDIYKYISESFKQRFCLMVY